MSINVVLQQKHYPLKVTELKYGHAYKQEGDSSRVIFGACRMHLQDDAILFGVSTDGSVWHSNDTEARFTEINVKIQEVE